MKADNILDFDEIDKLGRKSIDYEEYFGDMELDEKEKEERIKLAEKLEAIFLFYFLLLSGAEKIDYAKKIYDKYMIVALEFLKKDEIPAYIDEYAKKLADDVVETTENHKDDKYYTFKDRAMLIAENEANVLGNYRSQAEAIKSGLKYKTWKTKNDIRVRHTHRKVDNQTISIFDSFQVGDSEMMFPKDSSLGANLVEIAGCRCVLHYS